METKRPEWAESSLLMQDYYDHYWGFPVHDERMLFETLCLESFQAGLSWETIWKRRLAFQRAFANFIPAKVVTFNDQDIDRLCQDKSIIRNRRKIMAVINNAQVICRMHQAGQSFDRYVWQFVDNHPQRLILKAGENLPTQTPASQAMSKQFKKDGFKFVGPTTMYSFMTAVGLVNARCE